VALDLVHDKRVWAGEPGESELTYDPLSRLLELFEGVDPASLKEARANELAALPLDERLARRIVDGERQGLEDDLQASLDKGRSALDIINDNLLGGMRTVGELFGRGEMQLPFVLQSAEVMKAAVAYLEPFIEGNADAPRVPPRPGSCWPPSGATSTTSARTWWTSSCPTTGSRSSTSASSNPLPRSSGPPRSTTPTPSGMSGLLVKSTVVMKENLEELNARGFAARWPVLLGGAALTRAYVENDLAEVYEG